ncbi:MAG: prolyl oligopeptidase family serine peptidase [Rhodoglobus sp.]
MTVCQGEVAVVDMAQALRGDAKSLVTTVPSAEIESIFAFSSFTAVSYRIDGEPAVGIIEFAKPRETGMPALERIHKLQFEPDYLTVQVDDQLDWRCPELQGTVTSFVLAPSPWSTRPENYQEPIVLPQSGTYVQLRVWAPSEGGEKIPITIAFNEAMVAAPRPLVLNVYGAYGVSFEPVYSVGTYSLLDRGVILAVAHVRGGGEKGREWHRSAQNLHKHKSVDDFVSVAQHLVDEGWTRRGAIVAQGVSAGGTVVGAALNRATGLFAAAVVSVPFVDPLTSMLDKSNPLSEVEIPEWGDPTNDRHAYEALRRLSPYESVNDRTEYPAVLATAARNDFRVPAGEVTKWVHALRRAGSEALLIVDMNSGHEGPMSDHANRLAFANQLAWTLSNLPSHLGRAAP